MTRDGTPAVEVPAGDCARPESYEEEVRSAEAPRPFALETDDRSDNCLSPWITAEQVVGSVNSNRRGGSFKVGKYLVVCGAKCHAANRS